MKQNTGNKLPSRPNIKPLPPKPPKADILVVTWQTVQGTLSQDTRVVKAARPRPQADARLDLNVSEFNRSVNSLADAAEEQLNSGRRIVITPQDWGWGRGNPEECKPGSRHPRRDDYRWSLANAYLYGPEKGFVTEEQVIQEWTERAERYFWALADAFDERGLPSEEVTFLFDYETKPTSVREYLMGVTTYPILMKFFPGCRIGNWGGGVDTYMPIYYDMYNAHSSSHEKTRFRLLDTEQTIFPWLLMPGEPMYNRDEGVNYVTNVGIIRNFYRFLYINGVRNFYVWQTTTPDEENWNELAYIINGLDELGA